jgi:hypothetical protein
MTLAWRSMAQDQRFSTTVDNPEFAQFLEYLVLTDDHREDDAELLEDFAEMLYAVATSPAQAAPPPLRYETPPHMHCAYPAASGF